MYTTTGDRVTTSGVTRTYTVTLNAGTYYVGEFAGGNTSSSSSNITIDGVESSLTNTIKVNVFTLEDNTQYAFDANGLEIDITAGVPSFWEICEDEPAPRTIKKECYEIVGFNQAYQANTSGASAQPGSLQDLGVITIDAGGYEIAHTGVFNSVSAGVTITANGTHTSANQAASDGTAVFNTSSDRITPAVPSKTYTATLPAGTYSVYAWNGNGATVEHNISISQESFRYTVTTLEDGSLYAFDESDNTEVDISGGIPSDWTPCAEVTTMIERINTNSFTSNGSYVEPGTEVLRLPNGDTFFQSDHYDYISIIEDFNFLNYNGDSQLITLSNDSGLTHTVTYGAFNDQQTLTLNDEQTQTFIFNSLTGYTLFTEQTCLLYTSPSPRD